MEYTGLFPDDVRATLPGMYNEENQAGSKAMVKFFTPWHNWTWYASEGSSIVNESGKEIDYMFYGLVNGDFLEYGYFSLSSLQSLDGPAGLKVERDMLFEPTPLDELHDQHSDRGVGEDDED